MGNRTLGGGVKRCLSLKEGGSSFSAKTPLWGLKRRILKRIVMEIIERR